MSKTASRNKQRGRAFQAKLAEMSGGMNIGTLGGEDVMHEEFSYEAKTYDRNSKTHKGKQWRGDKLLTYLENSSTGPVVLQIDTEDSGEPLVLLRWSLWDNLSVLNNVNDETIVIEVEVKKFIGRKYMKQAEANCPDGKIPVVVVHTMGERHHKDVVVIYRLYWNSLLKKLFDKSV